MTSIHRWTKPVFQRAKELNKPLLVTSYQGSSLCLKTERLWDHDVVKNALVPFTPVRINANLHRDIDFVLMSFLRLRNGGGGGWPLHLVLSPHTFRPFMAASFLDAAQMAEFLRLSHQAWTRSRDTCEKLGLQVTQALEEFGRGEIDGEIDASFDIVENAELQYAALADQTPRFIMGAALAKFRPHARSKILRQIARSGIVDHLNGGVFSHALSSDWHLPSFQKRFEDQATLLTAVVAQLVDEGDNPELQTLARGLVQQIKRIIDGQLPAEKSLWTHQEFHSALKAGNLSLIDRDIAESYWGVNLAGNINEDLQKSSKSMLGDLFAQNVLSRHGDSVDVARSFGTTVSKVDEIAKKALVALRSAQPEASSQQEPPGSPSAEAPMITPDNIGLALSALAQASSLVPGAKELAESLAVASDIKGSRSETLVCSDLAMVIRGMLDYHRHVDSDTKWVQKAAALQRMQNEIFWDHRGGGYYFGQPAGVEETVDGMPMRYVNPRYWDDGAKPNYNGVSASNLLELAESPHGDESFRKIGDQVRTIGILRAATSPLAYLSYL